MPLPATVRLTKCRGSILGCCQESVLLKYNYDITSTVLPTDDNAVGLRSGVGAVLSGAEEALPRRVQRAEAGRSSAWPLTLRAMRCRCTWCTACRSANQHGIAQHGEIAQDGVPGCPQGLQ